MADQHIDAEELAAWSAGALPSVQAARLEEHLADCDRCQSMLAVFVRVEPPVSPPAAAPWWQRWQLRWLVPLATAATIAAIWVALPTRGIPVQPSVADAIDVQLPASQAQPAAAADSAPAAAPPTGTASQLAGKRPSPPTQPRTPSGGAAPMRDQAAQQSTPTVELRARDRALEREAAAAPPAAVASETRPAAAASAPAAPPPPPPPSPSAPARATEPAPPAVAETLAVGGAAGNAAARSVSAFRSDAAVFASPDGSSRWRMTGSVIERSVDAGTTWARLRLPAGATLTAGHAVSSTVAWVVGRAGTIYVTTNGTTFARVPFVEAVDLVAVRATDDRAAVVTTADGRTFSTGDRGVTWTPVQENLAAPF